LSEAEFKLNPKKRALQFRFDPSEFMPRSSKRSKVSLTNPDLDSFKNILISVSDDFSIKLWDVNGGDLLKTLEGHQDAVKCVELCRLIE
jgi:WD40 repeat protein